MHPFWRWRIAWKEDSLWSFPSWHFHLKTNAVSLLGRVCPRSLHCSALTSWQPITGRSDTYNQYWCWQSPPSLMLLVLSASPRLVASERNYSLSHASDLQLKGAVWCQTTTKYQAVSCLLRNMQVNNCCLIRLKSSQPRHNMNSKPCAGDFWRKVPCLLPCVQWLKSCPLEAVVSPEEGWSWSHLQDMGEWLCCCCNCEAKLLKLQNVLALEPRRKLPLLCKH